MKSESSKGCEVFYGKWLMDQSWVKLPRSEITEGRGGSIEGDAKNNVAKLITAELSASVFDTYLRFASHHF